jgi:peroxiredoxin
MKIKWLVGGLIGILLGIFSFFITDSAKPVPAIALKDLAGKEIALQSYKGKPLIVHFWATSCPGCIREMPIWIDIYNTYHKQGLEVIAVAMSYDTPDFVHAYARGNTLPFPVSIDSTGTAAKAFGDIKLTPTTIWIDRQGRWTQTTLGEVQKDRLIKWLNQEMSHSS